MPYCAACDRYARRAGALCADCGAPFAPPAAAPAADTDRLRIWAGLVLLLTLIVPWGLKSGDRVVMSWDVLEESASPEIVFLIAFAPICGGVALLTRKLPPRARGGVSIALGSIGTAILLGALGEFPLPKILRRAGLVEPATLLTFSMMGFAFLSVALGLATAAGRGARACGTIAAVLSALCLAVEALRFEFGDLEFAIMLPVTIALLQATSLVASRTRWGLRCVVAVAVVWVFWLLLGAVLASGDIASRRAHSNLLLVANFAAMQISYLCLLGSGSRDASRGA